MKRFIGCLLIGLLSLSWQSFVYSQDIKKDNKSKILVVYYSRTGNTKKVALRIAKKFQADILELIDKKERNGIISIGIAGRDAIVGNLTELEPYKINLNDYNLILIGTPSWFRNITPAIRTFIAENDLSKKNIGLFATTNITGVDKALEQLAKIISKDKFSSLPLLPLKGGDFKDDILNKKVDDFYNRVIFQYKL